MRNPERIFEFCDKLAVLWHDRASDWRFGQLVCNVFGEMASQGINPFFAEEDKMIEFFENYFNPHKNSDSKNA